MIGCLPVAGLGTRLGPLGETTPKCLLEFGGQTLLERAISQLLDCRVESFVFVVGHNGERIERHVASAFPGLPASYARQPEPRGIVDAVRHARELLAGRPFALCCPDNFFADSYDLARCFDRVAPGVATAVLVRRSGDPRSNRAALAGPFDERPGEPADVLAIGPTSASAAWVSTGFSIEDTGFFDRLDGLPLREGEQRLFDVWTKALSEGLRVVGQPLLGSLYDITTPQDVEALRRRCEHPSRGVAVILTDHRGRILLVERDRIPTIRYPGHWALFGGTAEEGETAARAACRELFEELSLDLPESALEPVYHYRANLKDEQVFAARLPCGLEELTLAEGRRMALFEPAELATLRLRDDERPAIDAYLRTTR